jgi:cytochrome c2
MMRPALSLALVVLVAAVAVSACAQEPVEQGRKYFMDSGCYGCHVVGKVGTPIGPNLSKVGRPVFAEMVSPIDVGSSAAGSLS